MPKLQCSTRHAWRGNIGKIEKAEGGFAIISKPSGVRQYVLPASYHFSTASVMIEHHYIISGGEGASYQLNGPAPVIVQHEYIVSNRKNKLSATNRASALTARFFILPAVHRRTGTAAIVMQITSTTIQGDFAPGLFVSLVACPILSGL
jgi:hypothetical protein